MNIFMTRRAPPYHVSLGPQPGPKKGDKKPVYVLNIIIPPVFVDNHVEPSKSAVNVQVRLLLTITFRFGGCKRLKLATESCDSAFLPLERP